MLPAGQGDALLLRYGSSSRPYSVLVDGGPYYSYPALRDRIRALPQGLRLLVATHVDGDHIEGIVKLLGDASLDPRIGEVWFNGWRHLPQSGETMGPVAGEYLSALIVSRNLAWNQAFHQAAIVTAPPVYPVVELEGGLRLTVLSPSSAGLRRLRRVWARTVQAEGLAPGSLRDAAEHMAASRKFGRNQVLSALNLDALSREAEAGDDSPANGSSIAMLAEFQGKSILLAGDAHPAVLEQAIRTLLVQRNENKLRLVACKLSHHGSKASTTNALLRLLDCRNYLIATNGSYFGHPDDEAVARIIRSGGPDAVLRFNYRHPAGRFWNRPELQESERFRVVYPGDDQGMSIDLAQ